MRATYLARNVSTGAVATIAAWSSWSHMVHVALRFGERPEVAFVLPISVDGMLIVASTAMVDDKRCGQRVRWSARIAFTAGVAASMAANIAAAHPSTGARIVAAWPAVALLLVVEMLSRAKPNTNSLGAQQYSDDDRPTSSADVQTESDPVLPPAAPAADVTHGPADGPGSPVTHIDPAVAAMPPNKPGPATGRRRPNGRGKRVTETVMRLRTERPDAPLSEIASEAEVSERHVRRILTSAMSAARSNDTNPSIAADSLLP